MSSARQLADKVLNFPAMNIDRPPLSAMDLADLDPLVGIIGFSFVESGSQMQAHQLKKSAQLRALQ